MTKTFDLTANELKAAVVLVAECLNGMGGDRPSDLDNDPYTWCDAKTLIDAGWSKEAAAGTYGSLAEKGFIDLDKEGDCVTTAAYQFIDTIWDAYHAPVTAEKEQTMTTFTLIDLANLTVKFAKDDVEFAHLAEETDLLAVATQHDLEEANLTGPQAVALYNATAKELDAGLVEVKRFADKASASKRLWANLVDLAEQRARLGRVEASAKNKPLKIVKTVDGGKAVVANKSRDSAAPAKASDYPAPAPKARRGTGVNLAPLKKAYACRAGSKQAIMVDMLSREQGATMPELLEALSGGATPWKEVSVKSGLNWDMNKIKGYGIRTDKRGEEDCYFLVLPEGLTAPIPHTVAASKKGA